MGNALDMRLTVVGLDVTRGTTLAIHDITFTARGGEWLGIVGANGSGKTSLLRAIAGRLAIAGGSITADGRDVTGDRSWRARTIGFAPDAAMLPDRMTAAQLFGLLADGRLDSGSCALTLLRAALGIDHLLDRRIGTLSSGNRQRIAVFAAFVAPAPRRAVILDEPFNWLDPVCAYDLKQALAQLVGEGLTLITALHDLTSWATLCDQGILLADGIIANDLTAAQLAEGRRDLGRFEATIIERLRSSGVAPKADHLLDRRTSP